ncbi:hypothetical protein U9M73_05355 [Paenibacillus phoenicis]|uniref:Uncharacterized protein n=1 Tax=Paenibacillus phoenicis TaxID=554117 RepID=A0ABU5PHJ7_9BACL|nr:MULTISPECIES: hypothetical protein [Paenibacillus]EES75217.1 hypothetical protein POTG_00448 [Paenibacillus sp. oral taxon 786 str. D14]MCT2193934.1 hypothetical protein [Paenibacillus sp. p3-SID1389]MEA3569424.1 hypothetical protein [Paenibacillus phoenicis]
MKRGNLKLKQGAAPVSKASKRLSPAMMDAKTAKGRKLQASRSKGILYIGPSVEGGDKEYVKVLTGDVDRTKPSFV